MNIFVAKLSRNTTPDDLKRLFGTFGEVRSAKIIYDRTTGVSKGYGFIEMATQDSADLAINSLNETTFQDAVIVVKAANPREDTPPPRRAVIRKNVTDAPADPENLSIPEEEPQPEE